MKSPLIKEHLTESTDTTPFEFLPSREEAIKKEIKEAHSDEASPAQQDSPLTSKLAFGLKMASKSFTSTSLASGGKKKSKLDTVFSSEADEVEQKPKRRIVPIDYSDEEDSRENGSLRLDGSSSVRGSKKLTVDERKKMVHNLVNSIPSSKEEVFQYILRWEQLDAVSVSGCVNVMCWARVRKPSHQPHVWVWLEVGPSDLLNENEYFLFPG